MKILEAPKFEVRVCCEACGALLLVEEGDEIRHGTFGRDYRGDGGTLKYYVLCPRCDSNVVIRVVPRHVANTAKRDGK
jgi:hypothetical protein